jgi:peptide chain release factor 1
MLADPEMAEMAQEEIASAEADMVRLHAELQTALIPRDPDDERNAFLEIRAGTGGDESACSPATWRACTCAGARARAGAPRS